ncbi:hypothetical protein B6U83_00600 [Thermoplasmatales archaeon ex4484_36]|nr:MAG: hypothetical protein B6U83_00600 [Thermoplasmatales archaeon ex4484_36]RLF71139.1 MAG: hypothetical protein DRN35_02980 [Thermoplasmata archaeon]RLF75943.1 MAG: hypothetical protein DRN42_01970 [Thermoplasmata archaeon]
MKEAYPVVQNVPVEIEQFFRTHTGEVLLLKGGTGTGKTLLAIEIVRQLTKDERGVMLFTRVEEDQLSLQFPHLKEGSPLRERAKLFDKNSKITDPNWFLREFTDLVKSDFKPKVVMIDTIDSLLERFENPSRMVRATLDVVQRENLSLIIVEETSRESFLDPLVGGIVSLGHTEVDGRKVRELEIIKMRGVEIGRRKYLFSLRGGNFRVFSEMPVLKPEEQIMWKKTPHPPNRYSSGIPKLDDILNGGFKRGQYIMIEASFEVSEEMLMLILRPIILNFIQNDGVVFITPPGGETPESIYSDLSRFLPEGILEEHVRFVDYFRASPGNPLVIPMTDRSSQKLYRTELEELTQGYSRPLMDLVGLDTLEYRMGTTATPQDLLRTRVFIRSRGYLGISIARPDLSLAGAVANFSDIVFKYRLIDNTPLFYGVKPPTGVMVPTIDREGGLPVVTLKELL